MARAIVCQGRGTCPQVGDQIVCYGPSRDPAKRHGVLYVVTEVQDGDCRANGTWWDLTYFARSRSADEDIVYRVAIQPKVKLTDQSG